MVSSVCRGSYPSMTPHASQSRKPLIDPQKDYTVPLQVETSVEYDLPAHIYPPKDSEPILMIHPGYVSAVRARSRAVVTPSPTAMVATSGATRPLAPLQISQGHLIQGSNTLRSSSSRNTIQQQRSWCSCGNPNCNSSSVKSVSLIQSATTSVQNPSVRSVPNHNNNTRSVQSIKSVHNNLAGSVQSVVRDVNIMGISATRSATVLLQQQQQSQQQQQQILWGNGGRCIGPCCNPRAGAMAPLQAEFVAPGLPPSLLARTPTRGSAGGSPKLRAARTRRGLSVASSVNLPDYLGNSRPARITGGAVHAHPRPRALSTSMGALAATPAPPMAHQQHTGMGASLTTTTSLDLARAHPLTPRSLLPVQQQQSVSGSTASLLYTVGLSRDSGCSVGADTTGGEWASDRTRGLVDSGFCTPVDLTDDFIPADTLSLGASWKEPSTPVSSSISSSSISSSSSSLGVHTSSSFLPGAAAHHPHHYLPQPLWNLAY